MNVDPCDLRDKAMAAQLDLLAGSAGSDFDEFKDGLNRNGWGLFDLLIDLRDRLNGKEKRGVSS